MMSYDEGIYFNYIRYHMPLLSFEKFYQFSNIKQFYITILHLWFLVSLSTRTFEARCHAACDGCRKADDPELRHRCPRYRGPTSIDFPCLP